MSDESTQGVFIFPIGAFPKATFPQGTFQNGEREPNPGIVLTFGIGKNQLTALDALRRLNSMHSHQIDLSR